MMTIIQEADSIIFDIDEKRTPILGFKLDKYQARDLYEAITQMNYTVGEEVVISFIKK